MNILAYNKYYQIRAQKLFCYCFSTLFSTLPPNFLLIIILAAY